MTIKKMVILSAIILSVISTAYFFATDQIILYGDAESHLDIAKRVTNSLTPGLGQLGGIWLPLPHLLMLPFVSFNALWQSGLAGSIVSGISYVVGSLYIYKILMFLTKNKIAAVAAYLAFALNPNILYMQATPMTEMLLVSLFLISIYYFLRFLRNRWEILSLIAAAFYGFLASLTRYEGWFLVLIEAIIIIIIHIHNEKLYKKMEGKLVLFSSLAFFGIALWLLWGYLILGDPMYFTNSPFSAKSQQNSWLLRNELPAYKNIFVSFIYYFITSMSNVGVIIFALAIYSMFCFILEKEKRKEKLLFIMLLLVPFFFYTLTLYMGQSVIFIPHLTPVSFEWRLFNVRYGLMMIPACAIFFGWLFSKSSRKNQILLLFLFLFQFCLYAVGYSKAITIEDGRVGLSHAKRPDAETWMVKNYDSGLVLLDDYARTMSIIRSGIPMENTIYIGNRNYWTDSLRVPEKYADWIVMQRNDAIWRSIYNNNEQRGRLYKFFNKAYTSKEILIFKKIR
jgi:hypothetical protein